MSTESEVHIRPTRPEDTEALLKIVNAIIARGDALVYEQPITIAGFEAYAAAYSSIFTAEVDGRAVGGYCLRSMQPGRGSHVANAAFTVDESRRGEGIGRKLGEHAIATARDLGFRAMQFNAVVSTNDVAIFLWRELGFEIVGTLPEAYRLIDGSFVDLFVMYRKL